MRVSFYGNSEINVLYFNDVHSKSKYVSSFKTAVDVFDKQNEDKVSLKLAGGDVNMDKALKPNMLILKLMDMIGLDASSVGNHDLEGGDYWLQAIKSISPKFKFLSSNMTFKKPTELQETVAKSMVIEKKGEKIGLVGVSPLDTKELVFSAPCNNYIDVMDFEQTLESVKTEVEKLEEQGIDKIFLLAHTGKSSKNGVEYYEKLAQIGGIDVIIGGHDHKEFDLWYKTERGEPVKVVSVGKAEDKDIVGEDLDSFGVLKAIFDEDGVLIPYECENKVELTEKYPKDLSVIELEEEYLNSSKVLSKSSSDMECHNRMTHEHPVADLAADAMLWLVNKDESTPKAQIALINSGTLRADFKKGDITVGMVRQALPFTSNTLIKTTLTKKQIIDALEWSAKSMTFAKIAPGLMQVGGMCYTINNDYKVQDVYLLNEDGSLGECLDDAPEDEEFVVAYDTFLQTGALGLESLKKAQDDDVIYYPESRQDALIEYLESEFSSKPVEYNYGRILTSKQAFAKK